MATPVYIVVELCTSYVGANANPRNYQDHYQDFVQVTHYSGCSRICLCNMCICTRIVRIRKMIYATIKILCWTIHLSISMSLHIFIFIV